MAEHLEPGGSFVIENHVPALRQLPPGENTRVFTRTPTHIAVEEYDLGAQIAVSHHYWLWPAELDLMARLAGLTLRERWSDWHRTPFTGDSRNHISVWEKAR